MRLRYVAARPLPLMVLLLALTLAACKPAGETQPRPEAARPSKPAAVEPVKPAQPEQAEPADA